MLNKDFDYPSLASRPTYTPDCPCFMDPTRNDPSNTFTPDEAISYHPEGWERGLIIPNPVYLLRSSLSWTPTPVGYR